MVIFLQKKKKILAGILILLLRSTEQLLVSCLLQAGFTGGSLLGGFNAGGGCDVALMVGVLSY